MRALRRKGGYHTSYFFEESSWAIPSSPAKPSTTYDGDGADVFLQPAVLALKRA